MNGPRVKSFAYPDESFEQIGGDCKSGMVEMLTRRPSPYAKCKKVSEGKGIWVEPSRLKTKLLIWKTNTQIKLPVLKAQLRIISPLIASALLVLIPGVLLTFVNESKLSNYWMAIITSFLVSCCFYLINVSYPKRKRIQFEALRIQTLLRRIVELKDAQYRILGFRSSELSHKLVVEDSMSENKARVLIELMDYYPLNKSTATELQYLREYSNILDSDKLRGYFYASHELFLSLFEELKLVIHADLFPKFYRSLMRMDEQLKYEKIHRGGHLFDIPEDYEKFHFRLIEYIECLYETECVPFVIYTPLARMTVMRFDEKFKKLASYPPSFSWDLEWPKRKR
ncbi:hypothetical protein [Endozoicomonas elysicola]|uniref:Uncharacterized protein n=1 Tax=Endozoicomonas elysicola TaxID=305900 RepID=A0A081KDU5_9GAMM|nr:hypothetical protein [Endozoicomonas elysicola]KEI72321.1 hypothetical protein GV64_17720 [Endozoicomonas elysicola]